jgi:hypothetical protein
MTSSGSYNRGQRYLKFPLTPHPVPSGLPTRSRFDEGRGEGKDIVKSFVKNRSGTYGKTRQTLPL